MKNNLLLVGIVSLMLGGCTVVYQSAPGQDYAYNNSSPSYQDQQQQDNQEYSDDDGYSDDWDADTSASPEPKIDFNSGAYDDGYVYNPSYFGSNFYAGNPFWGLGLYGGWDSWGWNGYSPFGWGLGVGYGWGGYYGWGSIYSSWGGIYGWPGYYGWGYNRWGGYYGGYHNWGYAPYIVTRAQRHTVLTRRGEVVNPSASAYARNSSSRLVARDMNLSNTRGVRAYAPVERSNNIYNSNNRSYTPSTRGNRVYTRPDTRSYSPSERSAPIRSYSPPERSAPTRSYSPPTRSSSSYSAPSRSYSPPARGRR